MAFTLHLAGDRLRIQAGSTLPKTFATARYAAPAVGHLAKQDTTAAFNSGVVQCAAGDVPNYYVQSLDSSNGTLVVYKVARLSQFVFEFNGALAIGDNVVADGSAGTILIGGVLRDRVKRDNTNGIGTVVELNSPSTGLCVVEFPSGAARGI